jgi:hypothetical protein
LLAIIVCALLNPGNFGTIDTARRWQVARSIRLGEPAVTPDDVCQNFGIPGRNGVLQAWYGIGQSLLLLPIDALVDVTVSPLLYRSGLTSTDRKQIAALTIAFLMQTFLTACVLLLARQVLLTFGFRAPPQSRVLWLSYSQPPACNTCSAPRKTNCCWHWH